MARGSLSKTHIATAILQVFPGAFVDSDGKTIRIPTTCEGEKLEIKLSLVCAKDAIGGAPAIPITEGKPSPQNTAMTESEIQEVRDLIARLNL